MTPAGGGPGAVRGIAEAVLETHALGKRYGRHWALRDCTIAIPAGKVVGLVGPNGAGKTTLLHLAVGLLRPSAGAFTVPPLAHLPNAWIYSTAVVDRAGQALTSAGLERSCPALAQALQAGPGSGPPTAVHACIDDLAATMHTVVTYQPAARFWPFQWAETGLFIAAAVILCGLAAWWLSRR